MSLTAPREGTSIGFHTQPEQNDSWTIGEPERIIWSSIKQLGAREIADGVLYEIYKIKNKNTRSVIASNIKLYLIQAFEFYEAAQNSKSNTAPLFFYYSFLNLAKALCEINHPKFHEDPECYIHGISWRPNRKYIVDMETEVVNLTRRGIWHVLWESIQQQPCHILNPLPLKIKDLFALNLEISVEYERTYGTQTRTIELIDPDVLVDIGGKFIWIKFSVPREELKRLGFSRNKFLDLISIKTCPYQQVESKDNIFYTFEFEKPKIISGKSESSLYKFIRLELQALNVFTHPGRDEQVYHVAIQNRLPINLPQLLVLYSEIFWLSSIVRYDPHSVANLQESGYWILVDGFMNQSRLWLLELFEWELYRTETSLNRVS
jgi:hypothetical protein